MNKRTRIDRPWEPRAAKVSICNARGNGRKLPDGTTGTQGKPIFSFDDVPGYSALMREGGDKRK